MEYIKVSRVIVRVRNSLVARCPRQAEVILVASVRGRCPSVCVQAQKRLSRIWTAWAGGVFEFHTLIHSFHNCMCNFQKDSSLTADMSPFGVEERDEPLSVLSEPELLWFCCSDPALEVTVEDDVEEERVFSLKSVIITVTFPTVTASCCAVLLSTFFSLGLKETRKRL